MGNENSYCESFIYIIKNFSNTVISVPVDLTFVNNPTIILNRKLFYHWNIEALELLSNYQRLFNWL